ncbi:guanylate cyclase, partial [Elysia marginata]
MFRALSLMLVPLLALTALACYWMVVNVVENQTLEEEKTQITHGQRIASVAYALQLERASVVYALQESNASMLGDTFQQTNKAVREAVVDSKCFLDKEKFLRDLADHREILQENLFSNRTDAEVVYYSEFTQCIMEDLMSLVKDMQHGTLWQNHVSFKMLLQATESVGMMLSLGIFFFERGVLPLHDYTLLREEDVSAKEYINIAALFSPFTQQKLDLLEATHPTVFNNINIFRLQWLVNNFTEAGPEKGREFHEAVMRYFNLLVGLTETVAQKVLEDADDEIAVALNMVTVACLVFIFVLVMTPVLIKMMHMLTSSIQNYAIEASQKSEQLVEEKARSDSLLYQMLPKTVAQQLKMNQTVTAECYDQ